MADVVDVDASESSSAPLAGSKRDSSRMVICSCLMSPPPTNDERKQTSNRRNGGSAGQDDNVDDDDVDGATMSCYKKPKVDDEEELQLTSSLSSYARYAIKQPLKGEFIIINNENFRDATQMNKRKGSSVDAENLAKDFSKLGFTIKQYKDLAAADMLHVLQDAAKRATADYDCFGASVLSHGDNDVLFGTDTTLSIEAFVNPIKRCPALIGKPKIFIFQACRGTRFDSGVDGDATDGGSSTANRIPLEADILYAYSTVPCYFSWRNERDGSWFIQSLHRTMQQFFKSTELGEVDFVRLLTRVSHGVAYEFQSASKEPAMNGKKQVPSIVSMLTKDLIFKRPS